MTKWLQDLVDAQGPTGSIPSIAPNKTDLPTNDGGPAWADAIVICPWTIYQCYGDTAILAQCYDAMGRFMDFLVRKVRDTSAARRNTRGGRALVTGCRSTRAPRAT